MQFETIYYASKLDPVLVNVELMTLCQQLAPFLILPASGPPHIDVTEMLLCHWRVSTCITELLPRGTAESPMTAEDRLPKDRVVD